MLADYMRAAMHRATYEVLSDGAFYGSIKEAGISRLEWEEL